MCSEGKKLSIQGVLSEIIKRKNAIYDVVYFYGEPKAAVAMIDELLRSYSSCYKSKNIIRMNGQVFFKNQLQNIKEGKSLQVLSEEELCNCDLFIFEEIDTIAGLQTTEQAIYGVLDWFLEHNVQIVITGSVPISHMDKLAPRICAQLAGGISCPVVQTRR